MADISDGASGDGNRRIEALTGPGRLQRWLDENMAQIPAETLDPGAFVAEVARRRKGWTQQVFTWRRE